MPQTERDRSWSIQKFASGGDGLIAVGTEHANTGDRPIVLIVDDSRRKPRPVRLEPEEAADVALGLLKQVVKGAREEDALRAFSSIIGRRLR